MGPFLSELSQQCPQILIILFLHNRLSSLHTSHITLITVTIGIGIVDIGIGIVCIGIFDYVVADSEDCVDVVLVGG